MTPLRIFGLLLGLASTSAFADRTVSIFPVSARAVTANTDGNSNKSTGGTVEVQLVNLSNLTQSIKVTLQGETITTRMYIKQQANIGSGWIKTFPDRDVGWLRATKDFPAREKNIRLPAKGAASVWFSVGCSHLLGGMDCELDYTQPVCRPTDFPYVDPPSGSTLCPTSNKPNQECGTTVIYTARAVLQVQEDLGAVIANFRVSPGICNGIDKTSEEVNNFPINGGRPF